MLDAFDNNVDSYWNEEVKNWSWISGKTFRLNMNRIKYALQHAIQTS